MTSLCGLFTPSLFLEISHCLGMEPLRLFLSIPMHMSFSMFQQYFVSSEKYMNKVFELERIFNLFCSILEPGL